MNIALMILGVLMCSACLFLHDGGMIAMLLVFGAGGIAIGFLGMPSKSAATRDFDMCKGDHAQH